MHFSFLDQDASIFIEPKLKWPKFAFQSYRQLDIHVSGGCPGPEPGITLYLVVYQVMIRNINIEKIDFVIVTNTRHYYRSQTTLITRSQSNAKRIKRQSVRKPLVFLSIGLAKKFIGVFP